MKRLCFSKTTFVKNHPWTVLGLELLSSSSSLVFYSVTIIFTSKHIPKCSKGYSPTLSILTELALKILITFYGFGLVSKAIITIMKISYVSRPQPKSSILLSVFLFKIVFFFYQICVRRKIQGAFSKRIFKLI